MHWMQYSMNRTHKGGYLALDRTCTGHRADAAGWAAKSSFVRDLHNALRHLYDPIALRHNPLLGLLDLEPQENPLLALRHLLLAAIEALKPDPDTPSQANAWRVYQILYERYAEQFSQEEVAVHLALGTRQLRRQETLALRVLADYLWGHYGLQDKATPMDQPAPHTSDAPLPSQGATPSREQELEWLKSYPSEPLHVASLIQPVLRTITPLAEALQVSIECALPGNLPQLVAQPIAIRQALSNIVTAAIHAVPGGRVHVSAQSRSAAVAIAVQSFASGRLLGKGDALAQTADDLDNLEIARRIAGFFGGSVEVSVSAGGGQVWAAQLTLPAASEVTVLIVDDNADTLQLLQRYLEGTRYRFAGISDPQQALPLAEEVAPSIIVLDVMLPGLDGWELLGRLREHPRTRDVPVIVCSILAQEQLALALGAAAFLRKPVSRDMFLAALAKQESARG